MTDKTEFTAALTTNAEAVTAVLDALLKESDGHENRVIEAMRYVALAGGKRVRPFLVTASAELFDVDRGRALRAAAAVEMVHCYSLVHDDLPAMDDDDLRRGKPTCHIAFDEATAILAGDALLTYAFEVLGDAATHDDASVRADLVVALAQASGQAGMVGGQMIDLYAEDHEFDVPENFGLLGVYLLASPLPLDQELYYLASDRGIIFISLFKLFSIINFLHFK